MIIIQNKAKKYHSVTTTLIFIAVICLQACVPKQENSKSVVDSNKQALNKQRLSNNSVTIYRDRFDVPYVVADNNYGVYFGYGYAVASDRLFQMEMLRRTVQGQVADVLGAEFLELDKHVRTAFDHRSVKRQLENLKPSHRELLDAYAQGFSARVEEVLKSQKELLPLEFQEFDFLPQSWTAYDAAMIFVGSIIHRYSDFNSELDNLGLLNSLIKQHGEDQAMDIFNASKWLYDATSPTTVPDNEGSNLKSHIQKDNLSQLSAFQQFKPQLDTLQTHKSLNITTPRIVLNDEGRFIGTTEQPKLQNATTEILAQQGFTSPEFSSASTYWSVSKEKLVDAAGVLVNGPQFGFSLPSYVYEIGLIGGDFHVIGNTLLGLPAILFAHNQHIAWGSTAGMSDQVDVYAEQLVENKKDHYWHNEQAIAFTTWPEIIRIKNQEPVVVTAKRSVHGMVLTEDIPQGVAYSRARAWEGKELDTLFAWIELSKQKDIDSARETLRNAAANINFYYIDVFGNQGYTHGGRYPKRVEKHDSRLPATGTGEYDWQGFRPFSDNPSIHNPKQNYIANWNNRPGKNWASSDLWTQTWGAADRVHHVMDELNSKSRFVAKDIWQITENVSYQDVSAVFLFPYLFAIDGFDGTSEKAIETLKAWDREWRLHDDDHYGAAELIVERWSNQLFSNVFSDDIGSEKLSLYMATGNPNSTLGPSMRSSVGAKIILRNLQSLEAGDESYDFFNGLNPLSIMKKSFDDAINGIVGEFGEDMSQWSLPAAKMVWRPYNFRGVPQASTDRQVSLSAYMNRGSENNLFIARNGQFRAYDVNPPGNNGFVLTGNKNATRLSNQLELYSNFQHKMLFSTIEEIQASSFSQKTIKVN